MTDLKDGRVTGILRAALTSTHNLRGIAALNSDTDMDLQTLRAVLGLKADADDAAILAAVTAPNAAAGAAAALPTIARAAGAQRRTRTARRFSRRSRRSPPPGEAAGAGRDQIQALLGEVTPASAAAATGRL